MHTHAHTLALAHMVGFHGEFAGDWTVQLTRDPEMVAA